MLSRATLLAAALAVPSLQFEATCRQLSATTWLTELLSPDRRGSFPVRVPEDP